MGKGSETLQQLASEPLTAEEQKQRREAAENGGDVQAQPDGRLTRIVLGSPQPVREAGRAASTSWD